MQFRKLRHAAVVGIFLLAATGSVLGIDKKEAPRSHNGNGVSIEYVGKASSGRSDTCYGINVPSGGNLWDAAERQGFPKNVIPELIEHVRYRDGTPVENPNDIQPGRYEACVVDYNGN